MDWAAGLTDLSGPFATVVLDASRDQAISDREVYLRWDAQARSLAEAGAPGDVIAALAPAVTAPTGRSGSVGRLAVAHDGRVALDLVLPEPPVRESSLWGPVPDLLPAVRALRGYLRLVLAEVDSAGAEIHVVTPWGEAAHREVEGDHDVLHRVPGGGWAQRRYQARVEDSVARNADEVAEALADVVRRYRPELVLLAGEEKAVSEVLDSAPAEVSNRVVRLRHGRRAAGADERARDEEVGVAVAERLREQAADVIDRFSREEALQLAAVQGVQDVVTALQRGQVEELLLVNDPSSDLTLWATGRPEQLAIDPAELPSMGAADGQRTRADAAIVWAAIGTGAGITLFDDLPNDPLDDREAESPPRLRDGIGALLRWVDESTPRDAAPTMPGHGEPPGGPPYD
jgi:hypothetical protein